MRDWIYVEDHCRGIWRVLQAGRTGEKYNIGSGCERTNMQVVDGICDELERQLPAARNPALASQGLDSYAGLKEQVADRPGHDRRYAIDATKARTELGWSPSHDLESGLAQTVRWYLDHRDWCEHVQAGTYGRQRLGLGN